MADRRYVENLIGNWNTNQYQPMKDIVSSSYNTNVNDLANQIKSLNDKLNYNYAKTRRDYNDALSGIQRNSFENSYIADQGLASKGLAGSGLANQYNASITADRGEQVNKAIEPLLEGNKIALSGGLSGVNNYSEALSDAAMKLNDEISDINDDENKNYLKYLNGIIGLSEDEDTRNSNNYKNKKEQDEDEAYRTLGIMEVLKNSEYGDNTKIAMLTKLYDVPEESARSAISSVNYSNLVGGVNDKLKTLNFAKNSTNNFSSALTGTLDSAGVPLLGGIIYNARMNNTRNRVKNAEDAYNKAKSNLDNYTYTDLNDWFYNL